MYTHAQIAPAAMLMAAPTGKPAEDAKTARPIAAPMMLTPVSGSAQTEVTREVQLFERVCIHLSVLLLRCVVFAVAPEALPDSGTALSAVPSPAA